MAKATKGPGSLSEQLKKALDDARAQIAQNMDTHGRNASGRSVKDLQTSVYETPEGLEGIIFFDKEVSWLYMEKGRGPNRSQTPGSRGVKSFTRIIAEWIMAKGFPVKTIHSKTPRGKQDPYTRGVNSLAAAIAKTIVKKGTRLYRNKQHDDIFTSVTEQTANQMLDKMNALLDVEVERYLQQ